MKSLRRTTTTTNDGRRTKPDGKSSQGLWPSELKRINKHSQSAIFKYPNVAKTSKSYNIECMINELRTDNTPHNVLGNSTYTRMTLTKIVYNHGSVSCFCGISNKELIFLHCNGYQNYINVFANIVILLGLPNVLRNIFLNY